MQAEPLDTGDVDALDELLDSPGWTLVKARLELQLARDCRTLEADHCELGTARTRGAVATVRMVLALPQSMREEISNAVKGIKK